MDGARKFRLQSQSRCLRSAGGDGRISELLGLHSVPKGKQELSAARITASLMMILSVLQIFWFVWKWMCMF